MHRRSSLRWLSLLAPLAALSCSNPTWGPEQQGFGRVSTQAASLEQGRKVYATYCVGCHGEAGDGNGPAAHFLEPKPRDFRVGRLKFATVAAGSAPRDEDYLRTINRGLSGTAMPAFNLLNEDEKRSLILYLRGLRTDEAEVPAPAVAIPEDPWTAEPSKAIAEGERLYHGMAQCFTCHPAYVPRARISEYLKSYDMPAEGEFRENLYQPVAKESEWGADITPPNFLVDRLKAGTTREDLVRSIATGVGGTAMPSWASALQPEQLWGLAYYVESLVRLRETPQASKLITSLQSQPETPPTPVPH